MQELALSLAALLALGIIAIGLLYLTRPRIIARGFGLPLPEEGPNIAWWLRLKGVRDVASGLTVFALMAIVGPRAVGIVLLAEAVIPIGDMLIVLAGRGSARTAFSVHGLTAAVMLVAAIPLALSGA